MIYQNKTVIIFENERQFKKIENSKNLSGKGETIDLLLIPKDLQNNWIKKFPNIALSLLPCLNQKTGKIIYY